MLKSIIAARQQRHHHHALRYYNGFASRFQVSLSNPINSINPTPPPPPPQSSTTSSSIGFPQISYFRNNYNNPRFFSNQISDSPEDAISSSSENDYDGAVHLENGVEKSAVNLENGVENVDDDESAVNLENGVEYDDAGVQNDEQGIEVEEEDVIGEEKEFDELRSLLQSSADGSSESCPIDLRLKRHQKFVTKTIEEAPLILGENLLRFFKWAWDEKPCKVTTSVLESVVLAICNGDSLRRTEIYSLWDLVKEIGEKENGILNVTILNALIISFAKLAKGKAALEVFDKFEGLQCVPDADTYYFTIEALCRRSAFDWASNVSQKMLDAQSLPDSEKIGSVLSWLCKGKKVKEAHDVYMAAIEKKLYPPMSSVNFLVAKLSQENDTVPLAMEMLNDIPVERRRRAIKPFVSVVRALCRIKDVDAAKQLILKMVADGPPPGNIVFNFVITAYSKAGEMGKAVEMLRLLDSRGLKPDVYSYAVIASGYSNGGEMEEARKILEEAKKKHSKLSPVIYHTLIRGYCKLDQYDKALELLSEMKDFGVHCTADEYEKLIQSLCLKALDWETAEKLQEEMKENGLYLKGVTRALISAVKDMEKEAVEAESVGLVA